MNSLRTVYVARLSMSGGTDTVEREEVNGTEVRLTMKFDRDTRQRISQVRSKYRSRALRGAMNFLGLQVVREDQLADITKAMGEADVELKAIDPSLSAKVAFIPVSADAESKNEMYRMLSGAINGFVLGELFQRLKEIPIKDGKIPTRSRIAVLDLVDRLATWNVFGDEELSKFIADTKRQLENDIVAPVVQDIEKQMKALQSEGTFVEL